MSLRLPHWLLAGALLLAAALARAQTEAPPDLYQEALQLIGEGRKDDASEALSRLIEREPLHAGAWLELALLQCALGHQAETERLLAAIETRFQPPQGIRDLIARTRREGCAPARPAAEGMFSIARGTDQNVNQGASNPFYTVLRDGVPVSYELLPAYLPQHDQYTQLSADYLRDLNANGASGFVQFQARRNDHLADYSSASLFGGVDWPWRARHWTVRASATGGVVELGGRLFQKVTQVQLRAYPRLNGPWQVTLSAGLTHLQFRTLSNFDSNTTELKSQLSYRPRNALLQLTAGALRDDAIAARPGGDRRGWMVSLLARHALPLGATGEVSWTTQHWLSSEPYSPGTINTVRDQSTQVWRALLEYPYDDRRSFVAEARQVRNQENISVFQYNTRLLQLSWQWRF